MTLEGEPAYDVPEGTESEVRMPTERPHPPEFKAKVVMQVISGEKTLNDVATEYDLNPNLVRKWRSKFEQEAYRRSRQPRTTRRASGSSPSTVRRSTTYIA